MFSLATLQATAQFHEIGLWGGGANYFGDLNPRFNFTMVRPAGGVFYRYNINTRCAAKLSISYAEVEFSDAATKIARNHQRNLSFKSSIADVGAMFEFNFFKFDKSRKKLYHSPYLGIGASIFFFNPKAQYKGKWYYLQPLGTEGQNDASYSGVKKYKLYSFSIPVEFGWKFSVYRNLNLGVFASWHCTFTDYLDDVSGNYPNTVDLPGGSRGIAAALSDRSGEVSGEKIGKAGYQRGESTAPDQFLFVGVTVSYTIMNMRCPTPSHPNTYKW